MKFGIARCSTKEQNEQSQIDLLIAAGVPRENIFIEKISGIATERPILEDVLSRLRQGDELYVCDLSRLARSVKQLLETIEKIQAKGASLVSLKESLDTDTPVGRMTLTVLASVCQFQREMIIENCNRGRAAAKKRGSSLGGRPAIPKATYDKAVAMYLSNASVRSITETLGLSAPSLYRELKRRNVSR